MPEVLFTCNTEHILDFKSSVGNPLLFKAVFLELWVGRNICHVSFKCLFFFFNGKPRDWVTSGDGTCSLEHIPAAIHK